MSKTKKFSRALALVIMLALVLTVLPFGAWAVQTNPLITTDEVDGLTISVDYATERVYLYKNSSTSYTVLCDADDSTYYPYSFSLIVNNRTLVGTTAKPRPTVSNGGEFTWAYEDDGNGNWSESATTTYGLVILPSSSSSTVTVTTAQNTDITFSCATPNGGSSTTTSGAYAFLPAPGQFTNEGMTTGGWGTAYTSNDTLKGLKGTTVSTGVSLGYFGGYVVFDFGYVTEGAETKGALQDDPSHPYGIDFIVYGNAITNNSEPGCVQVSYDGQVWYDLAGSMHYDPATQWNYKVTYVNPTPGDNPNSGTGTKANVNYSINSSTTLGGTVVTNPFHNHAWFPLEANYFGDNGIDFARGATRFPFAEYLKNQTITVMNVPYQNTDTLTLTGVLLDGVTSNTSAATTFGYFDCHQNGNNIGTATNPYTGSSSATGGDGMDLAWAVYSSGTNKGLPISSTIMEKGFRFVRCYNGVARNQNPFGEIGPEVCGIVVVEDDITSVGVTNDPDISIKNECLDELVAAGLIGYDEINGYSVYYANGRFSTGDVVTVDAVTGANVYVNNSLNTLMITAGLEYIRVVTQVGDAAPSIVYIVL